MSKALEPTSNNPRWLQRFEYYETVFLELQGEMEEANTREYSRAEKKSIVKSFEMLCELSWKTLRAFLLHYNFTEEDVKSPSEIIKTASTYNHISPETAGTLLKAIKQRNDTVHAYDTNTFNRLFVLIQEQYYGAFESLYTNLKAYKDESRKIDEKSLILSRLIDTRKMQEILEISRKMKEDMKYIALQQDMFKLSHTSKEIARSFDAIQKQIKPIIKAEQNLKLSGVIQDLEKSFGTIQKQIKHGLEAEKNFKAILKKQPDIEKMLQSFHEQLKTQENTKGEGNN